MGTIDEVMRWVVDNIIEKMAFSVSRSQVNVNLYLNYFVVFSHERMCSTMHLGWVDVSHHVLAFDPLANTSAATKLFS